VDRAQGLRGAPLRVASAALLFLLAFALTAEASAQRVAVEITPSAMRSEPRLAAALRTALPQEIRKRILGKQIRSLRVRITDAKIMREPGFGIVERADYLEGFVLLPGREPQRIRLTLPFDRSLFSFTPQGEALRVQNLIEVFAQWVAKYS